MRKLPQVADPGPFSWPSALGPWNPAKTDYIHTCLVNNSSTSISFYQDRQVSYHKGIRHFIADPDLVGTPSDF